MDEGEDAGPGVGGGFGEFGGFAVEEGVGGAWVDVDFVGDACFVEVAV